MCSKLFLYLLPLLAFANAEEKTCTVPVEDVDHPNPQEHKFNLTVDLGKINKKEKEWSKIKLTYDVEFTVMKAETDSGSFDAVPDETNAWIVERDVNHDDHPFFILKTITYLDGPVNLLKAEIQFNDDEKGEWHELCKEQQIIVEPEIVEPEIVEPEIVEPEIVEPEKPKYPLCDDFYNITEPFDNGHGCRLGYKGIFYLTFPQNLKEGSRIINYLLRVTMSKKVELKINDPEKSYREWQKKRKSDIKKKRFTFKTSSIGHHKVKSVLEKGKTLDIQPFQVNEDGNWSKNCEKSLPEKMEIGKWINRTLTWQIICEGNEN